MKLLYITILIAAYVGHVGAHGEDDTKNEEVTVDRILEIIKFKCIKNAGENAFTELGNTVNNLQACLSEATQNQQTDNNYYRKICNVLTNNEEFYKCLNPIFEKLAICLEEEEAYLPDFLYGAFNFTIQEFCGRAGRTKYSYIMRTLRDTNCYDNRLDYNILVQTCFPVLGIFKSANSNLLQNDVIVKESEICSDMDSFQSCAANSIREQCGEGYTKVLIYAMEPYLSWCTKHR